MDIYDDNFDDYTEEGVGEIDFDVDAPTYEDDFYADEADDWERDNDRLLEQQEMEDFAQDGYFENMEMGDDGFWC
jgi:hypothetical protein